MPSSVMFGSRPKIFWIRAYSSAVTPCSAAISGVTLISVSAVAISNLVSKSYTAGARYIVPLHKIQNSRRRSSGGLCCADEGFDHGFEDDEAVGGIERGFGGALGMRHEASDIAFAIADAGDVVHRAVGIACGVFGCVGRRIEEKILFFFCEVGDVGFVGGVAAVGVRNGNFQFLAVARIGKSHV